MLQDESSPEGVGKAYHKHLLFNLFKTNGVRLVSDPRRLSRASSPVLCYDDTLSASRNFLDYPEEVALYPSSRASGTPSVTGLEGPRTTKVFDVFHDDYSGQNDRENYRYLTSNKRKRVSENSSTSLRKRRRYRTSTALNESNLRGRRASQLGARDSSSQNIASNLAMLQNAIGFLKRAYNVAVTEVKLSVTILFSGSGCEIT